MTHKILITDPVDRILIDSLEQKGYSVSYFPDASPAKVKEVIGGYEAVVVRSRTHIDSSVLEEPGNLRLVARAGIGLDTIDVDLLREKNIDVIYAPGESTESVAELAIALMVIGSRNIYSLAADLKRGKFRKEKGGELSGRTLGIIGFGRIGFRTAELAASVGMKIAAYDVLQNPDLISRVNGEYCTLDDLLMHSDVVALFITMKKDDKPVLGDAEFAGLKEGAMIINTSRAAAIDGSALLSAVKSGKVSFYGADVLWNEPPRESWESELLSLDNVVITPHIGAQTAESQKRIARRTADSIIEYLEEGK